MTREEAAEYIRIELFNRLEEIAAEIKENAQSDFQLVAFHKEGDESDVIAIILSDTLSQAEILTGSILDGPPSMH